MDYSQNRTEPARARRRKAEQLSLDLSSGRARRDEGIARSVGKNAAYLESALQLLRVLATERAFVTGEAIRVHVISKLGEQPTSPHFWGSLTRTAATRGILKDTGRVEQMKSVRSHARRTPIWEFVR